MMGPTSHISCVYDNFSSYRIYFSLMMSITMIGLGLGHMVHALFHLPLENLSVVSVAQLGTLVESQKYFPKLVESQKYFPKSSILNLMIFDLYAVVSNFSVKRANNLIGSFS